MRTLIIGRESNLSRRLANAIPECELVSSRQLLREPHLLESHHGEKLRVIVNAFRPAVQLRDVHDREAYVEQALLPTARVLDACRALEVEHLVYTSSASVYGENVDCHEDDPASPRDLHAALKAASEMLVEQACREDGRAFTLARVFNMYGGEDRFSIVSKILDAVRSGRPLTVVNNGAALRDYIHIEDVVTSYRAFVGSVRAPTRLNVGSGRGVSVRHLLDALATQGISVEVVSIAREELACSTASVDRLRAFVDPTGFLRVEEHLIKEARS